MSTNMNDALYQIIQIDGFLKTMKIEHLNEMIQVTQDQLTSLATSHRLSDKTDLLIENLKDQLHTAQWIKAELIRR